MKNKEFSKGVQYLVLFTVLIVFLISLILLFSGPISFWETVILFAILMVILISGVLSYNYRGKINLRKLYKFNIVIFGVSIVISTLQIIIDGLNLSSLAIMIIDVISIFYFKNKIKKFT